MKTEHMKQFEAAKKRIKQAKSRIKERKRLVREYLPARLIADGQLRLLNDLTKCVAEESRLQVKQWHVQVATPFEWLAWLTEEQGELAKAINEAEYRQGSFGDVFNEAIQAATLTLKIAEAYLLHIQEVGDRRTIESTLHFRKALERV